MSKSRFLVLSLLLIGMLIFLIPGCDELITEVNEITIAGHPQADFLADSVLGCAPHIVNFTDDSKGPRNRWEWDFGDGDSSIDTNPSHTYDTTGIYTVTLIVYNDELETSDTKVKSRFITVGSSVGGIQASDTLACPGTAITFEGIDPGNIDTWKWNFGDLSVDSISQESLPVHVYDSVGVYTVTLTTRGECPQFTLVDTNLIRITLCPTAAFTATAPIDCRTRTIEFTDSSVAPAGEVITAWLWDFGEGSTAITQDASVTYNNSGSFEVSLTVTSDGGGSNTRYDTVVVYDSTTAAFSSIGPRTSCFNPARQFQVKFLADSPGLFDSLIWDFGDGNTLYDDPSPVHAYTIPGTYPVSLKVFGCLSDSTAISDFVVLSDPLPPLLYTISPDTGTVDTLFRFEDTSAPAAVRYRLWDFGDGELPESEAVVTHVYADTGSYVVTLTVFNDCDTLQILDTIRVEP